MMKKLNLKNRLLLEFGITALGYILLVVLMRIGVLKSYWPVSYTHLDVYKRQDIRIVLEN